MAVDWSDMNFRHEGIYRFVAVVVGEDRKKAELIFARKTPFSPWKPVGLEIPDFELPADLPSP